MITKDAMVINRFIGMMMNWVSEARTSYFEVRFSTYEFVKESQDIKVPSAKDGFYARGLSYVRRF